MNTQKNVHGVKELTQTDYTQYSHSPKTKLLRIPCSLCYCPAVFYPHLYLSVLSFPQGHIGHALQECYYSFLTV